MNTTSIGLACASLLATMVSMSGCVVATHDAYREGYYDHDHHRYYHENRWHECVERDEHCR